jgi:FkbM family methyltransferase
MNHLNQIVQTSVSFALRHTPEMPGRGRIARVINKYFPLPPSCVVRARMRLGHEMLVDLRSATEFAAYYTGDYDTPAIRSVLRLLNPDSIVFDVGANIGFWSVPLARHLTHGRLHCFEPVSGNFKRLTENIHQNSLEDIARLHQLGLSDRNGTIQISLRDGFGTATGNAAIVIEEEDLKFACMEIQICALDDIFDSFGEVRIDFVKADIEGHEDKFLSGASKVIRRFRPTLYLEINEPYYQRRELNPTDIFEHWLKANSYRSALRSKTGWQLESIQNRRAVIDNAFFFPEEIAVDSISRLNA